jgi:hypothetical protein
LSLLLLTAAASSVSDQFQHDWQSCLIETSKLWATKPGPADLIVDAATIHCREKLDLFMITEIKDKKAMGLNEAQASEISAILAGVLLNMNRGFAIEAVQKARSK